MISNMPTGHYTLPPLSEYTVTETIYPDPDAPKKKILISRWIKENGVDYYLSHSHTIRVLAPFPDDVELEFGDSDDGYTFVFDNDFAVSV